MRVDEFQQFGFWVQFQLSSGLTAQQSRGFWDSFITDAVETNQLTYGGSEVGFVVPEGYSSATESHRCFMETWLSARAEVATVKIGQLVDAWR